MRTRRPRRGFRSSEQQAVVMLNQRRDRSSTAHRPHNLHGGFDSLPKTPTRRLLRRKAPWRDPTFFDSEWLGFDDELKDDLAAELGLWDEETGLELDPDLVDELEAHDLEHSQSVHSRLVDYLQQELEFELDRRVEAGVLSKRQRRKELDHFREVTAFQVVDRMTPHILLLLQQEAGLA